MILGMMLSWLLGLGAILMTLGLSVNAIWRAVMPPSGLPRGAGCGSCGYELTTLTAGRCSECGADLIKSGVTTRRNAVRAAGSLPAALMGWTIIVITVFTVVFGVVLSLVAMNTVGMAGGPQAMTSNQTFRPGGFTQPDTGVRGRSADYEVTIDYDGNYVWNGNAAQNGTLTVEVEGDDVVTPLKLEYDIATEDFTITSDADVELASGNGYYGEDAKELLGLAGLDMQHLGIAHEAETVGKLFDGALYDPMNYQSTMLTMMSYSSDGGLNNSGGSSNVTNTATTMMGTSGTEMIVTFGILGAAVLMYGLGILFIVRRRGKLLAPPRNDDTDAPSPPPFNPPAPTPNA